MTRKRSIQIYSLCIISMVVLGALSDRALEGAKSFYEKTILETDVNAFLSGKSDKFIGWEYAGPIGK
ncbi:MAG: hypothetical protein C0507_19545 [Cyanobacteria bacterium PR.3.49]|nr:hypothetical protein [Cyanobacteria bacterium PR.3.49]